MPTTVSPTSALPIPSGPGQGPDLHADARAYRHFLAVARNHGGNWLDLLRSTTPLCDHSPQTPQVKGEEALIAAVHTAHQIAQDQHLRFIIPEDTDYWPSSLGGYSADGPHGLWVKTTTPDLTPDMLSGVVVTGARACTTYGASTAHDLGYTAAASNVRIMGGGAFGIDAATIRGALAGATTAHAHSDEDERPTAPITLVLAGGVDVTYPLAHTQLFADVLDAGGVLLSHQSPGTAPTRSAFLRRNAIMAQLGTGCVVVEAGRRSGAIYTATQAARLGRPVAAYPGPVTSPTSTGCHDLIQSGVATLVTHAGEALNHAHPTTA